MPAVISIPKPNEVQCHPRGMLEPCSAGCNCRRPDGCNDQPPDTRDSPCHSNRLNLNILHLETDINLDGMVHPHNLMAKNRNGKQKFATCDPPFCVDSNEHLKQHVKDKQSIDEPSLPWILTLSLEQQRKIQEQSGNHVPLFDYRADPIQIFLKPEVLIITALIIILSVIMSWHIILLRKLKENNRSVTVSPSANEEQSEAGYETPKARSRLARFILQAHSPTIPYVSSPIINNNSAESDYSPRNLLVSGYTTASLSTTKSDGKTSLESSTDSNFSNKGNLLVIKPRMVSPFPSQLFDSETDEETAMRQRKRPSYRRRSQSVSGYSRESAHSSSTTSGNTSGSTSPRSHTPTKINLRVISKSRQSAHESSSPSSSSFSSPRLITSTRPSSTSKLLKRSMNDMSSSSLRNGVNISDDETHMRKFTFSPSISSLSGSTTMEQSPLELDADIISLDKPRLNIIVPSPATSIESPHFGVYQADGISPDIALNSSFHKEPTPSPGNPELSASKRIPKYSPPKINILNTHPEGRQAKGGNVFLSRYCLPDGPPSALASSRSTTFQERVNLSNNSWTSPVNASQFPAYLKRHRAFGTRDYVDGNNIPNAQSLRDYENVL